MWTRLIASIATLAASALPQAPQSLTRAEAEADLAQLEKLIQTRLAYRDLEQVDYRALIRDIRRRLGERTTLLSFGVRVMKLLAQFGDARSRVRNPQRFLAPGFTPFSIEPIGKDRFVALQPDGGSLLDPSYPFLVGLDGQRLDLWLEIAGALVANGSHQQTRRSLARTVERIQAMRVLAGVTPYSKVVAQLADASGKTIRHELKIAGERAARRRLPGRGVRILDGDIGYLRLERMDSGRRFESFLLRAMAELEKSRGLVLDVRGNDGGDRAALRLLIPYLLPESAPVRVVNIATYRLQDGDRRNDPNGFLTNRSLYPQGWKGWSRAARQATFEVERAMRLDWQLPRGEFSGWHFMVAERNSVKQHASGPVVVLMDAGCAGATDVLLGALSGLADVTLLGTPSAGLSGRPIAYRLEKSGIEVELSSMASFRPSGARYTGRGIDPDLWLEPRPGDFGGKSDSVLDAAVARLTKARKASPFERDIYALTRIVREKWSYLAHRRNHSGLDLRALEEEALSLLGENPTKDTFARALRRYVAGLRDGHAYAYVKDAKTLPKYRWPVTLVEVVEGVMVDGVHDGHDVLRRGDLILSVDGKDIGTLIEGREKWVSRSSTSARRSAAIDALAFRSDQTKLRMRIRRAGVDEELELDVEAIPIWKKIDKPSQLPATRDFRMLTERIAYFRPGDFRPPKDERWSSATRQVRDEIVAERCAALRATISKLTAVEALVLDLRQNPGGTDLVAQALATHLLKPGFTYFKLQAKHGDRWGSVFPSKPKAAAEQPRFLGRLLVLIDEDTFSAADNLAACLRDVHPHVTFLGKATGAGTGAPRPFELPNTKATVTFCTQRVYAPRGSLIEGIGVRPDIPVVRSRADVLKGRDAVLEEALLLLGVRRK